MRLHLLLALFAVIMVFQVISLQEGFGGQPGTQIQMNANRPVYFIAAVPDYSEPTVRDDKEEESAWWGF
jgi:hypothetical protein